MLKRLPMILMMAMVAVGLLLEQFAFGKMQWISKIPIAVLLILAFLISARRRDAALR